MIAEDMFIVIVFVVVIAPFHANESARVLGPSGISVSWGTWGGTSDFS
jgi:hypothetical protein